VVDRPEARRREKEVRPSGLPAIPSWVVSVYIPLFDPNMVHAETDIYIFFK
jgi:hypothetical protein